MQADLKLGGTDSPSAPLRLPPDGAAARASVVQCTRSRSALEAIGLLAFATLGRRFGTYPYVKSQSPLDLRRARRTPDSSLGNPSSAPSNTRGLDCPLSLELKVAWLRQQLAVCRPSRHPSCYTDPKRQALNRLLKEICNDNLNE